MKDAVTYQEGQTASGSGQSMFGAIKRDKPFKDYCLVLQVHPEADAAMIDAAYWHLAKRYNEAAAYDPQARAKLEELNEAYIVLGSAEKREEYMKVRVQVLGEDALPQAPRAAPAPPPLIMMSRQRPQEREAAEMESKPPHSLTTRKAIGMFVLLRLGGVALAATTSLVIATTVEGAAGIVILAVLAVVTSLQRLRVARSESMPRPKSVSLPKVRAPRNDRRAGGDPLDKIKVQAERFRGMAAKPEDTQVAAKPAPGVDADQLDDLGLKAEQRRRILVDTGVSQSQAAPADLVHADEVDESEFLDLRSRRTEKRDVSHHDVAPEPGGGDPLDKIKRQAEQFRRIAASQAAATTNVSPGAATEPQGPEQLDKIKQQAERLRRIAAKFNASTGEASPDSPRDE